MPLPFSPPLTFLFHARARREVRRFSNTIEHITWLFFGERTGFLDVGISDDSEREGVVTVVVAVVMCIPTAIVFVSQFDGT